MILNVRARKTSVDLREEVGKGVFEEKYQGYVVRDITPGIPDFNSGLHYTWRLYPAYEILKIISMPEVKINGVKIPGVSFVAAESETEGGMSYVLLDISEVLFPEASESFIEITYSYEARKYPKEYLNFIEQIGVSLESEYITQEE